MHSSLLQLVTLDIDTVLSLAACAVFLRPSLRKNYPWMFAYLLVRALTALAVDFLRYGPLLASPLAYTKAFFVVYWSSCLASAVLLFLGCMDVYRQAMTPLQGLSRIGTTIFRWAAVASVIVTATTFSSISPGPDMLMRIGVQLMRCAGTAELCLLALLLLSLNAIGLSIRSRPFGIALGLGLMAAADCAQSLSTGTDLALNPAFQYGFETATYISLGIWIAYSVIPESAIKKATVRPESTIYRWDQIASALGQKSPQAVLQPAQSFFLVDVEKVVDRAFLRTLQSKEVQS